MSDTMLSEHPVMTIEAEIAAFDSMRTDLEKHHMAKFVVVKDGKLVGAYDTFDAAAAVAVQTFGRGPYLIRQVGAPVPHLPVSLLYRNAMPYAQWAAHANP